MSRYPMLTGIDEDRVAKIGGKAAILEEILRRWPKTNIPPFHVFDKSQPSVSMLSEPRVFRASSELDLFGGCGLHNTFFGVAHYNFSSIVPKILDPSDIEQSRLEHFAASVGKKYSVPTLISQREGKPAYWAVVMQHPNNPEIFVVAYSDGPSAESKDAFLATHSRNELLGKYLHIVPNRETHAAFCDNNVNLLEGILGSPHKDVVELAVMNYLVIQDLGIIHPDWVSILEAGIYPDRTETYQFTPIRRKTPGSHEVVGGKLIFGVCEPVKLPVVNLPSYSALEYYVRTGQGLKDYPDLEEFVRETVTMHGQLLITFNAVPGLFWKYMQNIEERYPEGYVVIAPLDKYQEFDIPMTKAKAVLIDARRPLLALNHSTSRLMHKTPVMVVDDMATLRLNLTTGSQVSFFCNGSNYAIS